MKTIQFHEFGNASVLQFVEVDTPVINDRQVLIRIQAGAVNPVDIKMRMGYMKDALPKPFPIILGWEASGIIDAVGNNTTRFKVGDEVYTMPNFMQGGTYAEYVAVNENEVALKPKTISHIQAASVPMVAGAAYTAIIKSANIEAGQKILIHGAAGAVGSFAVQMAKAKGAYVIGTATGAGINILKSLGADEVIDYSTTDFAAVLKGIDIVLDLVGGETLMKSFAIVRKDGLLLSTVMPPPPDKAKEYGISAAMIFTQPDAVMLTEIANWIDEGKVKLQQPVVLSLNKAQQAHEMIESRTAKGKIVFDMNAGFN